MTNINKKIVVLLIAVFILLNIVISKLGFMKDITDFLKHGDDATIKILAIIFSIPTLVLLFYLKKKK